MKRPTSAKRPGLRGNDRTRPLELLTLSAIMAVFTGAVVFLSTRQLELALIFLGIAFIVSLVGLAMLALAAEPNSIERRDIEQQDDEERRPPLGH